MNGAHDMGAMHGMGPVVPDEDEPVFHEGWEARILALNLAMASWGKWNLDQSRFARENVDPARYLGASYYERILYGLESQIVDAGFLTPEEIEARVAQILKPEA